MRCWSALLLLAALCACDREPLRVGVVIGARPAAVAPIALSGASELEPVILPTPDATAADIALRLAQELVADPRVRAVVGHSNSAASIAASQVYNEAGLVQIAPTSTAPVYDDAGPYSFRMVPSDTAQARYIAQAAAQLWPGARVALAYVNDDYGRGLASAIRPRLTGIVFERPYADAADPLHVRDLAADIVESTPDVVLWLGRPARLRVALPILRRGLPEVAVLCSDACDDDLVQRDRAQRYEGVYFVRFIDPEAPDSAMSRFQDRFRSETGQAATVQAVLTHDALRLVLAAVRDGARTREQIRDYLVSLGRERPAFAGLAGPVTFDEHGSARRPYLLGRTVGGRASPVEVLPR